MANKKQLEILKQGVESWNKWRNENSDDEIDLSEADLTRADLTGANLTGANLKEAYLDECHLQGANLNNAYLERTFLWLADLTEANLSEAELSMAILADATLINADLSGAQLGFTNLTDADLSGVNFTNALVGGTIFGNNDLSTIIGFETIEHWGPATIGTDAIQKSKGKIPAGFLRGCGLSEWEIETAKLYNPELINHEIDEILYKIHDLRATQPLQISPLFISYSHADSPFVDKIEEKLNEKGIRF